VDLLVLTLPGRKRRFRIVADAFLELSSTMVDDRARLRRGSAMHRLLLAFQRHTLGRADLVLIDSPQQAGQLREKLAPSARVLWVPVGIDEAQWQVLPPASERRTCRVLFWGTFIPLHGVEYIVEMAALLEQRDGHAFECVLVGDGQCAGAVAQRLARRAPANLRWERRLLTTDELRDEVRNAHIVLGIFGSSAKADSVIPYKVYQALASNRVVVSAASTALSTIADEEAGLYTCRAAEPRELADAVESAWQRLRSGWQPHTRRIYEKHLSREIIAGRIESGIRGL
jgi:glycosyltransferase involved in cell wall biosynthesis